MLAVMSGNQSVASLLLQSGARVGFEEESGTSALHVAAQAGQASILQLLEAHSQASGWLGVP